jgi:hypothetical protein
MDGTDFQFTKWDRLRLRDTVDPAFYGHYACVGNEGWITDVRQDGHFGLPEVYIKWDKNHWAYNGAPDRWTFQEHFELVAEEEEEEMSDSDSSEDKLFSAFQKFLKSDGTADPKEAVSKALKGDTNEQYAEVVQEVSELLDSCEGFVVIGVTRRDHPKAKDGMLVPVALSYAKTTESGLLALASAAQYSAEAHGKLVLDAITQMHENK